VKSVDKPRVALAAIVLIALALRLAWIAYADYQPTLSDDAGRYDFLGRSLAEGGAYANPNGNTTMFWPPGYPFLLAAVYKLWPAALLGDHEVTAALVLNALAGAATTILVYALAWRTTSTAAQDVTAREALSPNPYHLSPALAYALLPSAVFYAGTTLTETWFTFLLMLAFYLLVLAEERASWPIRIAAAAVIGYAALVRGQALLLPLVAIPFWHVAQPPPAVPPRTSTLRHLATRIAITTAIAAAIVLPWTARNYIESDRLVAISSNAGVDFYIGHSPGADGRGRIVDDLVLRYPDLPPAEAEARVSSDGFREGVEYAFEHPVRELELSAKKLWYLYNGDHEALAWTDAHGERPFLAERTRDALAAISSGYFFILMALAAAGIVVWLARRRWRDDPTGVLLLSVVAYYTLVHIAFFADPRFHAPIMPLVCVWAASIAVSRERRAAVRQVEGQGVPNRSEAHRTDQ
jgi:4-amino-4-deoxy-L-arabinose transferase-like glycosyltransferase